MAKKIQGLSPNFFSVISPNIPESLTFRWVFTPERRNEVQERAVIRIYKKNFTSTLMVLKVKSEQEISIANSLDMFKEEGEYEWEVEVTSSNKTTSTSERAPFRFASIEMHDDIVWPDGPQSYEYIGSRKYFTEIRENTISVIGNYTLTSNDEIDALLELPTIFTGSIVPNKKDFLILEKALRIVAEKEHIAKQSICQLIEDGLDASDIHKIYDILSNLSKVPPYQPTNFSVVINNPKMYGIERATAISTSDVTTSIETKWNANKIEEAVTYIAFDHEINDDISYYKLDIITGFEDAIITHPLYYRIKDIKKLGNKIYFQSNHHEYKNISASLKGICGFNVVAVDKRKQESINYSIIQPAPSIHLGVSHYVLQNEIYSLTGAAAVKPYGEDLYSGSNVRYTHYLAGDVSGFYHYRVKVVDKNGEESEWFEFGPVKIDTFIPSDEEPVEDPLPLDGWEEDWEEDFEFPSSTPTKPTIAPPPIKALVTTPVKSPVLEAPKPVVSEIDTNSALIVWRAVKNADSYEIKIMDSEKVTETSFRYNDLEENTSYTVMVRSINKSTVSDWIPVSFVTPSKPIISKEGSAILSKCWRNDYHIKYRNGNQAYSKGGWRNDIIDEIIQGEWIELPNKAQEGSAIEAGTRWGNHKSIIMFDSDDWITALEGKEILKVEMYIKRTHAPHGYANDGKALYIYTHNYSAVPDEEPIISNRFEIKNQLWDRGQGHWIHLPNKFGELIQSGEAKGIALHHPNIHLNPPSNYSYCKFDANSIKLKIHYK